MSFKIGDIVARKSYGSDILFKVVDIKNEGGKRVAILKGICYRLEADAPESDLMVQPESYVREYNARINMSVDEKVRSITASALRTNTKKKNFIAQFLKRKIRAFQNLAGFFILTGITII